MSAENLLSIAVPCYNESSCVVRFVDAIKALNLPVAYEIVFVDDGSVDDTLSLIKKLADGDDRIRYVSFSRNFGKEAALLAGLEYSKGSVVVTMDVDLQHKPEMLLLMYKAIMEEGYDCAAAIRTNRDGEPMLRSWFAHRFYNLMNKYSEVSLKDGLMDYRMMTRQVVDSVLKIRETNRFTKGIYQWVGFKTKWLETGNCERVGGNTKWSLWGLFCYSMKGIVSFSTAPLQIASILGTLCCVPAFLFMTYISCKWLFLGERVAGWATLICVILFLGGLQLFVIGILGTYIAFTYREAKHRPIYMVREAK